MIIERLLASTTSDRVLSEIILADILNKDRSFLYAHQNYKLSSNQALRFIDKLKRLDNSEPLAYILGYKEFYGLKFFVNKNVLIPRPETEGIIDLVKDLAKSRNNKLTICDVGTGSGCIAITLAKHIPQARIYATDISKDALSIAKKNAKYHHIDSEIIFMHGDLLYPLPEKVDVIVANLPYIKSGKINNLKPQISKWEPRVALDGGNDGKKFYNQLFSQSPSYLKNDGLVFYEIDGKIHTKTFNNLLDA